jgi:hypothetical protein
MQGEINGGFNLYSQKEKALVIPFMLSFKGEQVGVRITETARVL